ncbi:MRP-L46 domain-containing protein [Candida albicans]
MRGSTFHKVIRTYSTTPASTSSSISSTLVLSRLPIITPDVPKFDQQFYNYQTELWRRLMWTFPKWFYFRPGTLSEQKFKELNENPVSYDPKVIYPRGKPDLKHNRDRRFRQYIRLPKTYKEESELVEGEENTQSDQDIARKIVPNSRITEADKKNDSTSLERKLSRTLYLVVKQSESDGEWKFPNFKQPENGELVPLHESAETGLYSIGGKKINYFNVSRVPCHVIQDSKDSSKQYFIKSHILSGAFEAQEKDVEFKWLTKEELGECLSAEYYKDIEHLLNDV